MNGDANEIMKINNKDSSADNEVQDSEKTIKREPSGSESQKEVRMLLEYLFLDVKVRTPDEVSWLSWLPNYLTILNSVNCVSFFTIDTAIDGLETSIRENRAGRDAHTLVDIKHSPLDRSSLEHQERSKRSK